jgi:crotonobetainyl-CoA:carnitine CoA-transferase CaiB-like acyl-CoA transferase
MAGFGTPATAFSGFTSIQGFKDRHPVSPSFSLTDYITGIYVAFASVMAIYHRDVHPDGSGQSVDISLYESMFRMFEFLVAEYDKMGKIRERSPMLAGHSSPAGTYPTKDNHWIVLVTSTDSTFERLAKAMGREDLLQNEMFNKNSERLKHDEEINRIVAQWILTLGRDELLEKLEQHGVPASPILSIEDIFEHPHYKARENIIEVEHPRLGTIKMPGIVPKLDKTPGSIRHIAPDLGQHNYEILTEYLNLSNSEIDELKLKGVL